MTPLKTSSKDFTLGNTDLEQVTKMRAWAKGYFGEEFEYENTLYMELSRVKDHLANSYRQAAA